MNVIIHDLTDLQFQQIFPQIIGDPRIVSNKGSIRNCIGCFGCWIKTPGQCVMKDGYENMGSILSQADTVTIISKCYYGGYSPFVKNVLDRSIPFLLPFFCQAVPIRQPMCMTAVAIIRPPICSWRTQPQIRIS